MNEQDLSNQHFRTALAGLDLTEMDDHIIRYAAMMCRALSVEKIVFVHIAKSLELPQKVLKEYPDLLAPLDESIQMDLQKKIGSFFDTAPNTEVIIEVKEGDPIEKILRLTKIKEVDLILMGRKRSLKGSGIVSSRIARKSPCSLLLIPENSPHLISKIMVPVDFSRHSALAVSCAGHISEATGAELFFTNVYKVPSGYHATGKSYQEFASIMEHHAHHDYQDFLVRHQLTKEVPCFYLLSKDGDYAERLYQYSRDIQADLIVLGSRGRTSAAVVLIGSLAEKLTYLDHDIPLFIVKEKGENMGFIQALMRV